MEPRPGLKTTEFWLTMAATLIQAVFPLLVFYRIVSDREAELWQEALMLLVSAVAVSLPTAAYSYSRGRVKTAYALGAAVQKRAGSNEFGRATRYN